MGLMNREDNPYNSAKDTLASFWTDKHMELEVEVMATTPIAGYSDLLAQYTGNRVQIRVAEPPELSAGQTVKLKARLAGPGLVWDAADSVVIQLG